MRGKVGSSRPSTGRLPVPVLHDLNSWHEHMRDYGRTLLIRHVSIETCSSSSWPPLNQSKYQTKRFPHGPETLVVVTRPRLNAINYRDKRRAANWLLAAQEETIQDTGFVNKPRRPRRRTRCRWDPKSDGDADDQAGGKFSSARKARSRSTPFFRHLYHEARRK